MLKQLLLAHANAGVTKNYVKCPKIYNTKVSDKMTYANSADSDQTAPERSGLHFLPFH